MFERIISLEIEHAYMELKAILLKKKCVVLCEESPKYVSVKQGSLHGVSPKSAKKVISYSLFPIDSGTRIVSVSSLSSDWANLTLYGSLFAAFVAAVFWWISSEIETYLTTQISGYWTWLAEAYGYPNFQRTLFMVNVTRALAIIIVATIILEILIVVYVYRGIDTFSEEVLRMLP